MALQFSEADLVTATLQSEAPASTATKSGNRRWLDRLTSTKLTGKDRMFFTEQLSLLSATGMALYQALQLIEKQASNPAMRKVVSALAEDLSSGRSLSQALAGHPRLFNGTYVSLVAAGEQGGFLSEVLQELLRADERREELRSAMVSAFTYPVFLLTFSFAVVVFVLVYVFPKFGSMFEAIADDLPGTTVALLAVSDAITAHWYWMALLLGVAGYALTQWMAKPAGRTFIDARRLDLPMIGPLYGELYTSQTLRVLSLSLNRGVPIVDALRACRDVANNSVFHGFLTQVEETVTEGGKIADGFDQGKFVPELARQMVRTAEEAGSLGLVGERMADYYENELRKRLDRFSKVIEPVMLIVMGFVVSIIVSSLILPIFKLSRAVS